MLNLFIFFKFLIFFFSILVVNSRSVMVSLLNLTGVVAVLVFFCFFFNFDFIAMIYLIIYMGAVTVLFLFVLMMLHLKKGNFESLLSNVYFLSILLVISFSWFFFFKFSYNFIFLGNIYNDYFYNFINYSNLINFTENLKVIGSILYTFRFFDIIVVTLILLIGMIGSITIVLNFNVNNSEFSVLD